MRNIKHSDRSSVPILPVPQRNPPNSPMDSPRRQRLEVAHQILAVLTEEEQDICILRLHQGRVPHGGEPVMPIGYEADTEVEAPAVPAEDGAREPDVVMSEAREPESESAVADNSEFEWVGVVAKGWDGPFPPFPIRFPHTARLTPDFPL